MVDLAQASMQGYTYRTVASTLLLGVSRSAINARPGERFSLKTHECRDVPTATSALGTWLRSMCTLKTADILKKLVRRRNNTLLNYLFMNGTNMGNALPPAKNTSNPMIVDTNKEGRAAKFGAARKSTQSEVRIYASTRTCAAQNERKP